MPKWRNLLPSVSSVNREPILTVQTILSHVADAAPDPRTKLRTDTVWRTRLGWWLLSRLERPGLRRDVRRPVAARTADAPPRIA